MADLTQLNQQLEQNLAKAKAYNAANKTEPDKTKKLADSPTSRTKDVEPTNMSGTVSKNGHVDISHEDHKDAFTYFREILFPNGSSATHEASSSEGAHTNELHAGHHRQYVGKGKHDHADGNHASSTSQNRHVDTSKDTGGASGGDVYNGAGGKKIEGTGQGTFNNNTGGSTHQASSGDVCHYHDGDFHQHHDGDYVKQVTGNKIDIIGTGEYGVRVNAGNFDISSTVGKGKIKSGQTLTLESTTNIILKVGPTVISITPAGISMLNGSSTISVTPASVTIKSPIVNFIKG
jgi:hypothetical protein